MDQRALEGFGDIPLSDFQDWTYTLAEWHTELLRGVSDSLFDEIHLTVSICLDSEARWRSKYWVIMPIYIRLRNPFYTKYPYLSTLFIKLLYPQCPNIPDFMPLFCLKTYQFWGKIYVLRNLFCHYIYIIWEILYVYRNVYYIGGYQVWSTGYPGLWPPSFAGGIE